jgi:ATP-dependent Clp protease ATP-binding subunit ClpA
VFERFTERGRRVVTLAHEESGRLRQNYIGTERLLLGLICEGEGVAAQALYACGVALEETRDGVRGIVGCGEGDASQRPLTSRPKRVLGLSLREAHGFRHDHTGAEHLLLGPLAEGEGISAAVLSGLGVEPANGFEPLNHAWLSNLVERAPETRDTSPPEAVVGLSGDPVREEVPSIREVTVTREDPAPGVAVSATFRR